jgi:arylsulfatase A-like enzyme
MTSTRFFNLVAFSVAITVGSMTAKEAPPNIIYIMLDEWGYFESSAMEHRILDTPNMDRIGDEGIRFTQFLAGANVCAPTRNVLMTGQHSGHTTVRGNRGTAPIRDEDLTLAEMLKPAGYISGGFGKWGLGDVGTSGVPERQGFDEFFGYYHQVHAHTFYPRYLIRNSERVPLPGNTGDFHKGDTFAQYLIHEEGMKFIRANHDRPFFAYLAWTPPHGQWGMPEDEPAWIKYRDKDWKAENQKGTHDAQMYAALVEMADRHIGEILALLEELEIDENTVIFLSGDNGGQAYFKNDHYPHGFLAPNLNPRTGERFRGGKGNFYEGGLRIPFMVRYPGKIDPGRVSEHLGYFPDIMPTLAEFAGVPAPAHTDGYTLIPTLLGRDVVNHEQRRHKYLYWEDLKSRAVRMDQWKAIQPDHDAPWELYHLDHDIEELNDLAATRPEILAKMKHFAQEAHEPVRDGVVYDASEAFDGHLAPTP